MRKRHHLLNSYIIILLMMIGLVLIAVKTLWFSAENKAEALVDEFYSLEQKNNYSDSWELFHPFMKEKFPKTSFIQDRSHVFIGHFGAESFTYEISNAEKVENWRAAKGGKRFNVAYRFLVTQSYKGKYGRFSFVQEVFTVKEKDQWVIVWDYNE